jgi:hypothetical protein
MAEGILTETSDRMVYSGNTGPLEEAVYTVTLAVQKCSLSLFSPHCTRTGERPGPVCLQRKPGWNVAGFHRAISTTISVRAGLVVPLRPARQFLSPRPGT